MLGGQDGLVGGSLRTEQERIHGLHGHWLRGLDRAESGVAAAGIYWVDTGIQVYFLTAEFPLSGLVGVVFVDDLPKFQRIGGEVAPGLTRPLGYGSLLHQSGGRAGLDGFQGRGRAAGQVQQEQAW